MKIGAVVTACLLACSVIPVASGQESSPGLQAPGRDRPGPRLYLKGSATLEAPPDFASVSIEVSAKAPTTAGALDQTSAAAGRIVAAARSFGIDRRDLQTGYVSLQPAYRSVRDPNGGVEQRSDGYQASNSVAVRVRDLARLGDFLRTVVDGGANRIGGVVFGLADPTGLERQAVAAAVRDAREQAEIIVRAAGVRLGRVEEIRYGVRPERPAPATAFRAKRAAPSAAAPPVPVEAGALAVEAEVDVVFAIEQP